MPTGFKATELAVIEEDGVLITTLGAPSSDEDGPYLMLQHKDAYDEQDVELGMNLPYIEYCGQGWSWHGHITSFTLRCKSIHIQMDSAAAARMSNDGELEVHFNLSDAQLGQLHSAVKRTFEGYSYFHAVA